jgi:NADH-quinone oxidoreductase subunit C
MWAEDIAARLEGTLSSADTREVVDVPPSRWREAVSLARDSAGCDFFDWLSAVDEGEDGLRVVVHLWSLSGKRGMLIRTLAGSEPIESIVDVYPGAAWHERETHEMFGLPFTGNPDLSPLLLAPEFEGHPLRKDFVLASRVAKPWPGAKEPGGDHGPRKRQPMRPPGVPAEGEWGPPPAA